MSLLFAVQAAYLSGAETFAPGARDGHIVHRARVDEWNGGDPLSEVRTLLYSMLYDQNIMSAHRTIKCDPSRSVLKYNIEDEVKLREPDFKEILSTFFAEIEGRYLRKLNQG